MNLSSAHPSQKFYGGGGENGFKEGRDDTAAGISSIKPFFNQEVVIVSMSIVTKEIEIIHRLFLVIAMYCQTSSSQFFSITQPLAVLACWEGSLGACSR